MPMLQDLLRAAEQMVLAICRERFLDKCIYIPGLLHIISNLTEDVDKSLLHWKEYSEQVATIETLLAERGLRGMYPVGTSRDQ